MLKRIPIRYNASSSSRSKPPVSRCFYEILNVPKSSSADEIKKAYKKAALEHHPDRGGDVDKFKEISNAYSILSDNDKRAVYDKYGEAGLSGETSGSQGGYYDPMDIFSQAFGGSARRQGPMKGRDAIYQLELSLKEIFSGATRTIAYTRDVACSGCGGKGATKMDLCKRCGGSGVVLTQQNVGFWIQMQTSCPDCEGQGYTVPRNGHCAPCKGSGTVPQKETFNVVVPPGCPTGHQIRFAGKADHLPGYTAGDVIIQIAEKSQGTSNQSNSYVRVSANSSDLCVEQTVSLSDALGGCHFSLSSLDEPKGDKSKINTSSLTTTSVVAPGDVWVARGLGLPRFQGTTRGDLYVKFHIQFPKDISQINQTDKNKILAALGNAKDGADISPPTVKSGEPPLVLEKVTSNEVLKKISKSLERAHEQQGQNHKQEHRQAGPHPHECHQQ